ncbi:MAG: TraR/DksA family transcriptional regulator [Gemmatimonadota bacterium]
MTKAERERIEQRLLEERRKRIEVLAEIDERFRERLEMGDDELTKYPLHIADEGTDTMYREKELLLAHTEGEQLLEIDDALRRMYREPDAFGVCESCGSEIRMERLELVPWARLCIACKQAAETAQEGTGA